MLHDSRIQNQNLKNSIENVQIHNVTFDNGVLSLNPLYVDVETALSTEEKSAQSENHLVCLDYLVNLPLDLILVDGDCTYSLQS